MVIEGDTRGARAQFDSLERLELKKLEKERMTDD
jgi:hypothetical protein